MPIRESLKTRAWTRAQAKVREWESSGTKGRERVPVGVACQRFLEDCSSRGLADTSVVTYRKTTRKLEKFCGMRGIAWLDQITTDHIAKFRSSWSHASWTSLKRWEQLRTMFRYFMARKWIDEDPTLALRRPIARMSPTLPFSRDEVSRILEAVGRYPSGMRYRGNQDVLRAFVLTLRYTGLRISDVWRLREDSIRDGKLLLHTVKTGTAVWLPLPQKLLDALAKVNPDPAGNYFWSTSKNPHTAYSCWHRRLVRLFKLAGIEDGHAHRFRDTFAVEMLLAGIPIGRVSIMLGHQSVRVTERHYSPWVRSRQDQLEEDVKRVWGQLDNVYSLSA